MKNEQNNTQQQSLEYHLKLQEQMRQKLAGDKTKGVYKPSKAFDYINLWDKK